DGAALLRKARHVEHRDALALEMRGHAEQRADRHHAGAADASDQYPIRLADRRQNRLRQIAERRGIRRVALRLAQAAAVHGDEARAEAVDAGIVLVAGRLVDRPLAAKFGLHRHDREAVRLRRAIAAALAHRLVDEDALGRIGVFAALAPAALLGGAGLVVDQDGDALDLAQIALNLVEPVAVVDVDPGREADAAIFLRLAADHDYAADA